MGTVVTERIAVNDLVIDGVRTFHVPAPGPTRATLHVGVGLCDETFPMRGVTHALEHVVMSACPAVKHEHNAAVDRTTTTFWAAGRPQQVGAFLESVGSALADVPLDALERERGVLAAERAGRGCTPHDVLLTARFGNRGLGLAPMTDLGPLATDDDALRAWAQRWFVRSNAVLTVLGELPPDLRLGLPDGPRPARRGERRRVQAGWFDIPGADPALGFLVEDSPAALHGTRALVERLERDLRHRRGLVYGIEPEAIRLPGEPVVAVQVGASCAPGAAAEVASAFAAELREIAAHGTDDADLDDDLESLDAYRESAGYLESELVRAAELVLAGSPDQLWTDARTTLEAVRPEQVSQAFVAALGTALLLTPTPPEGTGALTSRTALCATIPRLSSPPLRRRLLSKAPPGTALAVTDDGAQLLDENGDVHEVRFADCVGVGVDGPGRMLFAEDGCAIWVSPRDFRGADEAVRTIDRRVAPAVFFTLEPVCS